MSERGIRTHFQPIFYLIIRFQTTDKTSIIRIVYNTFVFQITERRIKRTFLVTGRDCYIVLLTQTVFVGSIQPIIRSQKIFLSVVIDKITDCSVRIQLSVTTDHRLTCRYIKHIIPQSVTVVGTQVLVSQIVSLCCTVSVSHKHIFQTCVIDFIVLCRIINRIICFSCT